MYSYLAQLIRKLDYKDINAFMFQSQVKGSYKCNYNFAPCFLWCHIAQVLLKARELCISISTTD